MINYDLPWNPTRLEQRLGRIHRIGQTRDVYVFNFVATESQDGQPVVEGRILGRLLEKLERMRQALGSDRVYDVIGQVLALHQVDLAEMLRQAAYDPRRLDEYLDQIERIDLKKLEEYERLTGIALARAYVDFRAFQKQNVEAEERRLMPEYVARQFLEAAKVVGLRVEERADGLWRIPYVPADLRSQHWRSVRRYGKPEGEYRKVTFYKEHLETDRHLDAVLLSPGHPLYAVVDEALNEKLSGLLGSIAHFFDPQALEPYRLHFFEMSLVDADDRPVYAELVAVQEADGGLPTLVPPDVIHDLVPWEGVREEHPPQITSDPERARDFVKAHYLLEKRREIYEQRHQHVEIARDFLERSFQARIYAQEEMVMKLKAREAMGDKEVALALQEAERRLEDLRRDKEVRLSRLRELAYVRPGPVRHLATFIVWPMEKPPGEAWPVDEAAIARSEQAAMDLVMEYERQRGWEPEDVSHLKLGFDIRSLGPADETGRREVRRIEVKGRRRGQPIRLTVNEWLKARQLGPTYWLYVVWNPTEPNAELVTIQDPAHRLGAYAREVRTISYYEIPAEVIEL